jgi:hypothetical protein
LRLRISFAVGNFIFSSLIDYLPRASSSLAIDMTSPFSSGLRSMRPDKRNRRISNSPVDVVSIDGFPVFILILGLGLGYCSMILKNWR